MSRRNRNRSDRKIKESTPPGGMTYEEIGKVMGITKQGVRKIEKRAIRKIRKKLIVKYGVKIAKVRDFLLHD